MSGRPTMVTRRDHAFFDGLDWSSRAWSSPSSGGRRECRPAPVTAGEQWPGTVAADGLGGNLNASLPAVETRERYREHRELILKAWSEPQPFPWNGRFEKYGQVNIWPRPVQQPHPPIWIPGTGSPGTLRDILQHDYVFVYLSWDGPKLTGRQVFDRYWELADELGRDRNPYRLAFLQVVAVSETDERAEQEYARHLEAHYRSGLGAIPHTAMAVPGYAEPAAIEGMLRSTGPAGMLSRMRTATYKEIVDSQVAIVGSPATVADQIEAFVREFRIGNLLVMLQNGSMPRELTEKNTPCSKVCRLPLGNLLPPRRPPGTSAVPRSSPGRSPTTASAADCTASRCRRSSSGGARTRWSRWSTRRSSAAGSRAAGWRCSTTAGTWSRPTSPSARGPRSAGSWPARARAGHGAHKRLPDFLNTDLDRPGATSFSGPSAHGRSLHMSPQGDVQASWTATQSRRRDSDGRFVTQGVMMDKVGTFFAKVARAGMSWRTMRRAVGSIGALTAAP